MSAVLRTCLALGLVLSAVSCAEAGSRSAMEMFPTLATLPSKPVQTSPTTVAPPAPTTVPVADAKPDGRAKGRGRRSRYARLDAPQRADRPLPAGAPSALAQVAAVSTVATPSEAGKPVEPGKTLTPGQEPAAKTPAEAHSDVDQAHETAAPTIAALIAKHAVAAGVPVGLAQAVVRIESRGNARAAHAGALGLMQIKAGTARAAGFIGNATGLFDADTNLHYGMKVLADAYKNAGGDICRALMKYQSGHLATHMTPANRTYCSRARAIMAGA